MNKEKYLERIGLNEAKIEADLNSLMILQKKHLFSVPFETLIFIGNEK